MEIREIRDITNPESFDRIHKQLLIDAKENAKQLVEKNVDSDDANTTRLVRTKLATLATLAKREGSLSEQEISKINKTMEFVDDDLYVFTSNNPSHAEIAADKPGRDAMIKRLRQLPLDVFAEAALKPITRSLACELKQAVILTLRLCTRSSDAVLKKLIFDQHFYDMAGEHAGWLGFRVPPCETANGKERVGVLRKRYADLLRIFVRCYRAALDTSGTSPYLLPTIDDKILTSTTMSAQQSEFFDEASGYRIQIVPRKGSLDESRLRA